MPPPYRPETALARWRVLTVLVPNANILGDSHTLTGAALTEAQKTIAQWPARAVQFTDGMCWPHQRVVTVGDTITFSHPLGGFGEYTNASDAMRFLEPLGIPIQQYDTAIFIGPDGAYNNAASGITDAVNFSGYCFVPFEDAMTAAFAIGVMVHEWCHSVIDWYGTPSGGNFPMPDIDQPGDYRHADGTAFESPVSDTMLKGALTGDIEDIATSTERGMNATVWASPTPRVAHPL